MKRIAVIAIAVTTFAVGLNVGRYVESVKSAPVINVTVNGVSTESKESIEDVITCEINDTYSDRAEQYKKVFNTTKSVLLFTRSGDKLAGLKVMDTLNYPTRTTIFFEEPRAAGGMVIARCEY